MPESVPSTRRERHAAERKQLILTTAARLFAERGFHRATTKDIAEAADVSEGTLYNYFESKDEILLGIMSMLAEQVGLADRLYQNVTVDPQAFLLAMLRLRRQQIDDTNDMLQAVLSEILVNPPLRERYYQEQLTPYLQMIEYHLGERQALGQLRPFDPALLARLVMALMHGLYLLQVLGDPVVKDQWSELAKVIVEILIHGAVDDSAGGQS